MIYELSEKVEKVASKPKTTKTSSDSLSIDGVDLIAEIYNRYGYGDDNDESNNSETYSDKLKNSIKELQNNLSGNGIIQVCYIKNRKIGKPKNISLLINKNENDITVDHIKEEIGEVSAFAEILRYHPTNKNPPRRAVYIGDYLMYRLAKSDKDNNIFVKF